VLCLDNKIGGGLDLAMGTWRMKERFWWKLFKVMFPMLNSMFIYLSVN